MATLCVNNTDIDDLLTAANQSGLYVSIQHDPKISEPRLKIINSNDEFAGAKYIAGAIKQIPTVTVKSYATVEFPCNDAEFHDYISNIAMQIAQNGILIQFRPSSDNQYVFVSHDLRRCHGRDAIINLFNNAY